MTKTIHGHDMNRHHQVPLIMGSRSPTMLAVDWDSSGRYFSLVIFEQGSVDKRTMVRLEPDYAAEVARFVLDCLGKHVKFTGPEVDPEAE